MVPESNVPELDQVIEEYLDRLRRGELPTIEDYTSRFPMYAQQIGELLPTLHALEHFRSQSNSDTVRGGFHPSLQLNQMLGDFRLIREIGRGGMGIVYEAEQVSLGRRVAIKVLSDNQLRDESFRKRFLREARSAAALHHTNIVPVFGVGEQNGIHFYAMQYIDGLALDTVLKTLRLEDVTSRPPIALALGEPSTPMYWKRIANLGRQAAEALHYAHQHRIIHRDIKPANLIVDAQATVWVTDFGLAKMEDQQDLTQTGDLLGTLRYMAPEQLLGNVDLRSDIYSLGATIYELLSLRPAFQGETRGKLIYQITNESATPLRKWRSDFPRDLSLIIEKSLERESAHRYQSAKDLADDLQRFLRSEPILARRISSLHRTWLWSRRNPIFATMVTILVLMGLCSPFVALYFNRLMREAQRAEARAEKSLMQSLQSTANARRFSNRPGQHFQTLGAIREIQAMGDSDVLSVHEIENMRGDAIAALALPDLVPIAEWPVSGSSGLSTRDVDFSMQYYCYGDSQTVIIRRFSDNEMIAKIPVSNSYEKVRFNPDGRHLSISFFANGSGKVEVWNWRNEKCIYRVDKPSTMFASDFSSDGRFLAVGHLDSTVSIHDLLSLEEVFEFEVPSEPITVAFHPKAQILSVNCERAYLTQLWDIGQRRMLREFLHPEDVYGQAWSADGRLLAVVEGDQIFIWDTQSESSEPYRTLLGHSWVVSELFFHPNGRFLYSHSWRENATSMWNLASGEQILAIDGFVSKISREGELMAFRTPNSIGLWKILTGEALIQPFSVEGFENNVATAEFSSDSRLLATASDRGVGIWDTSTWNLREHRFMRKAHAAIFSPDAQTLYVSSRDGIQSWEIHDGSSVTLRSAQSLPVLEGYVPFALKATRNGEFLATNLVSQADGSSGLFQLFYLKEGSSRRFEKAKELRFLGLSPDGQWLAGGCWQGLHATIWNTKTGEQITELDTDVSTVVAFSNDGSKLATASISEIAVWDTNSWKQLWTVPCASVIGSLVFSPDNRMLAHTMSNNKLQLLDIDSGRHLVTLSTNHDPTYVQHLAFSPNGSMLAMSCGKDKLQVWSLDHLRSQLESLKLAW